MACHVTFHSYPLSVQDVEGALSELSARSTTWKKTRERGKPVYYIFLDNRKIGRAKTKAGVPWAVQKHLDKLAAGETAPYVR